MTGKFIINNHYLKKPSAYNRVWFFLKSGRLLIFDDVLATGGTAQGSIECLKQAGYNPIGSLFLVELEFLNPQLDVPHSSIIKYNE